MLDLGEHHELCGTITTKEMECFMSKILSIIAIIFIATTNVYAADLTPDTDEQARISSLANQAESGEQSALAALKQAGNEGNMVAQSFLGYMYLRGQGVAKDYEEAFK